MNVHQFHRKRGAGILYDETPFRIARNVAYTHAPFKTRERSVLSCQERLGRFVEPAAKACGAIAAESCRPPADERRRKALPVLKRSGRKFRGKFVAAADKTAKGLGSVYETLDQINARIDLPKKMAREQEELNRALKRYCELCEEARRREQARIDSWKSPKNQWNQGAGAGSLHGLGGPGGSGGGRAA